MKILLAPLQGLTNHIYRKVLHENFGGFDIAYSPYFSMNRGNPIKKSKVRRLIDNQYDFEIVPQILTNDAEAFILFSNTLSELGIKSVNLNMGCPYPVVTKKGKGVAMMKNTRSTHDFFDDVFSKNPIPISVKLRLGFKSKHEIYHIINLLNNYPISEIIVHPRIGEQYYSGDIDYNSFENILKQSKHEVVFNGDINSVNVYKDISNRFPDVQKVMIGRGVLQNPYLFKEIKGLQHIKSKNDILDFTIQLTEELSQYFSKGKYFPQSIKEHWKYLSQSFNQSQEIFNRIKICESFSDYKNVINQMKENSLITLTI